MKYLLLPLLLSVLAETTAAAPLVYTNQAQYLAALTALPGVTLSESFEDDAVWVDSRNSIVAPGRTPQVISQGIRWTSNYAQNELATGNVGGSAPDGTYAIYSLPHGLTTDSGLYCDSAEDPDIPGECFQNDGLQVSSATGDLLYAFGGRISTATSGKVTFLLDGTDVNANDTDNLDNWQREGEVADNWEFVGVVDPAGFTTAELRELKGKDFQQVLLFADAFTLRTTLAAAPGDFDSDGDVDGADFLTWQRGASPMPLSPTDLAAWQANYAPLLPAQLVIPVPEPTTLTLLGWLWWQTPLLRRPKARHLG